MVLIGLTYSAIYPDSYDVTSVNCEYISLTIGEGTSTYTWQRLLFQYLKHTG